MYRSYKPSLSSHSNMSNHSVQALNMEFRAAKSTGRDAYKEMLYLLEHNAGKLVASGVDVDHLEEILNSEFNFTNKENMLQKEQLLTMFKQVNKFEADTTRLPRVVVSDGEKHSTDQTLVSDDDSVSVGDADQSINELLRMYEDAGGPTAGPLTEKMTLEQITRFVNLSNKYGVQRAMQVIDLYGYNTDAIDSRIDRLNHSYAPMSIARTVDFMPERALSREFNIYGMPIGPRLQGRF